MLGVLGGPCYPFNDNPQLLWPCLKATDGSRLVIVSSIAHKKGVINFDDFDYEKEGYKSWTAYGRSKLSNLLMMKELDRRVAESDSNVMVLAAHPGVSATDLPRWMPAGTGFMFSHLPITSNPDYGCLAQVRAATDPNAKGGEYYGPKGWFGSEWRGPPGHAFQAPNSADCDGAKRLWELSEELIGEKFEV